MSKKGFALTCTESVAANTLRKIVYLFYQKKHILNISENA